MIDYNEPQLDPNYRDISYIGEIEFPGILNKREIGGNDRVNFKNIGKCKIEVYSKEGQVPHFHLCSVNSKFESCIKIYSAEYFPHGGKYEGTLNSKQCKVLDKWMKEPHHGFRGLNNWQVIAGYWETDNPNCLFPEKDKVIEKPKYDRLNQKEK